MLKKTFALVASILILASCGKPKETTTTPVEGPGIVEVESKEETPILSSSSSSSSLDISSSISEESGDGPIEGPIIII
ncbi:MAG: hypothetical protein MJ220_02515 [Bacilli bacterium]|nr:hypothetical protein [Bacilli bacterium]